MRLHLEVFNALLCEDAERCAREDALAVVNAVRNASGPIVWITSNSYFPPLREIGSADRFYSGSFWNPSDAWIVYVETFEEVLERERVYMTSPEYDNALYAVDLQRFEYVDGSDETAETLDEEWTPVAENVS